MPEFPDLKMRSGGARLLTRSGTPAAARSSAVAVDLGGTKVVAALVDRRGRVTRRVEEPVDTTSPSSPVDQVVRLVSPLIEGRPRPAAAGIAVPGLVRMDGTVWAPNLPGWERVPLARSLSRRLHVPVSVESDRNAVVLGEAWRGAARGERDVVVLMLGTGIGAGILSGGRLVRGAHELSGCAGWMVVTDRGHAEAARCGSLEALAAGPAVARAARRATAHEAAAAARAGDAKAREAFATAGRLLGLALANVVSLFDPQVVVLTGGLTSAADLFLDELTRNALLHAQPLAAREVRIVVSALGSDANLLGAGRLAFTTLERIVR